MNHPPTKRRRKSWHYLAGLIVFLFLFGFFHAEENWRGKKAWENCKRALRAQGVDPDWAKYIPTPIPDNENVFGVPEMRKWFQAGGAGWNDLAGKLSSPSYPGVNIDSNTTRMVVARVMIGLPGTARPDGFTALQWNDSVARKEAARLLANAIGPVAKAPQSSIGVGLMLRRPEEVQSAQIFLQCQTTPTVKDLHTFLPDTIVHAETNLSERVLKFEPDDDGSYRVTLPVLARAIDYLAWSDGLEAQFSVIKQALRRPSSQMLGYYGNSSRIPGPDFRAARSLAQTLGARAQSHLLLGQSSAALNDLTLIHDFCRIFEDQKPMTLLAAMINVAVRGLYVTEIAEGLRLQAWRDSDLAALQEQLKTINVVPPVKQAFTMEAMVTFRTLESVPSAGLVKRSSLSGLCPRGWGYQHMTTRLRLDFDRLASLDSTSEIIFADKVKAADRQAHALEKGWAYTFVPGLGLPNFVAACQRTARIQTQVHQAIIACALERYHLAHGEYPENLDALVPRFLNQIPRDVIGGRIPRYRRADGGTFVLYSVGWNEAYNNAGPSVSGGEWIWPD